MGKTTKQFHRAKRKHSRERERERGGLDVVESETNVARKPRTVSYLYSPAVRTSTLSRMDSKRVVARYPCIMIISHLDTLNPAPCHRPVASCTIFLCLALFHPARHRSPRPPQPTFTASFLLRSNLRFNLSPTRLPRLLSEIEKSRPLASDELVSLFQVGNVVEGNSILPRVEWSPVGAFHDSSEWREPFIAFHRVAIVYEGSPLSKD